MNQSNEDTKSRREREIDRLRKLRDRRVPESEFNFQGVLRSDAIKECVSSFGLITPFDPELLKPACYRLTIGDQYSINGEIKPLDGSDTNKRIEIPPFAVAIIKTHETINMPEFLIGRWNVQVSRAYQGLLWVGGPQVDPGWVGHLFCPIYNLSAETVVLYKGQPIAVIDFVRTSEVRSNSKTFKFPPNRVLFEEYEPQSLVSGLVKRAQNRIDGFEADLGKGRDQIEKIQARVDSFVLITFTVIAVLFAAVTIFVTRSEQATLWNPSLFLLSLTSIVFSSLAWLTARNKEIRFGALLPIVVTGLLIAAGSYLVWDGRTRPVERQIEELKREVEQLRKQTSPTSLTPPVIIGPISAGAPSANPEEKNKAKATK